MKLRDLDFVFISYDEPNADSNFDHLASLIPQAQRVHGIKGWAAAHHYAASIARTPNFIIVDGDCRIRPEFIEDEYHFQPEVDLSSSVISWCSLNNVNGLAYGNGGIKCWPRQHLLDTQSHEQDGTIDFDCGRYLQMNSVAGDTYITGSRLQAWRAGFREGVKLSLLMQVEEPDVDNERRLWQWCHIGLDVATGMWAIAGARQGCRLVDSHGDVTVINDIEQLNRLFERVNPEIWLDDTVIDPYGSCEYKKTFVNPPRSEEHFLIKNDSNTI